MWLITFPYEGYFKTTYQTSKMAKQSSKITQESKSSTQETSQPTREGNIQSLTVDEAAVLGFEASKFYRLCGPTEEEPNLTPIEEILYRSYTLGDLDIENRLNSFG